MIFLRNCAALAATFLAGAAYEQLIPGDGVYSGLAFTLIFFLLWIVAAFTSPHKPTQQRGRRSSWLS